MIKNGVIKKKNKIDEIIKDRSITSGRIDRR